jgi:hypothetical protein
MSFGGVIAIISHSSNYFDFRHSENGEMATKFAILVIFAFVNILQNFNGVIGEIILLFSLFLPTSKLY